MKIASGIYYEKSMGTIVMTQHFCLCMRHFHTSSGVCVCTHMQIQEKGASIYMIVHISTDVTVINKNRKVSN